ncbi:MAG: DEAD/DEAH box helicase, partial [Candidatus Levyibacteriota bacterium]
MDLLTPVTKSSRAVKMFASRLEKLNIFNMQDFLLHLPSRYEDYSLISQIAQVQPGEAVTIQGRVMEIKSNYMRGMRIKTMQKALVTDGTGTLELTWFNQPFLTRAIPTNATISASGRVDIFGKSRKMTMQSPQYEILINGAPPIHTGRLIPIYPETHGVSSKWLRRQVYELLTQHLGEITEYMPEKLLKANHLMDYKTALQEIHFPKTLNSAEQARERLAFDELFFMQLGASKRRTLWQEKQKGIKFEVEQFQRQLDECINSLPFKLTGAQQTALEHIFKDFQKDTPTNRLVQGDVGSGKTVVAAIAMYLAYLNGYQSVLMAPTEILANQHFDSIAKLLEPLGVKVELVTGSKKKVSKTSSLSVKGED